MYHVSKADKRVAARIPMKFLNKKTAGKKGENKLQKSGKKNCGNRRDTEKRTKGEIGRNQKTEKNRNARTENPLQRAGIFLAEKTGLDQPGKRNKELCRELIGLASGNPGVVKNYYGKKFADSLLALMIFAMLSLVVFLAVDQKRAAVENNQLQRPAYGMGDRQEELIVHMEGETESRLLSVTVQERKFTDGQIREYLESAKKYLEQNVRGENPSLDEVREKLNFPVSLENGAVTVSWLTFPYGMIGEDGEITGEPAQDGSVVELQATLTCQGTDQLYETAVCVYPQVLTEQEQLWKSVSEKTEAADASTAREDTLTLPDRVEQRQISWEYPSDSLLPLFLVLTILVPLCLFVGSDQKVHEKAKKRELQMKMEYPELMWKLTMLLGAGLTIRSAFLRIASEYQKENQGEVHYVYEEVLNTCYEMKSGVSEGAAYENFGRRCGLPKFIKLGSLLEQNLRKGYRGLVALLEKEAVSSMEERKNLARKLGEQAGNRMLFPMMLMLGIVLVILVVPAFLSF